MRWRAALPVAAPSPTATNVLKGHLIKYQFFYPAEFFTPKLHQLLLDMLCLFQMLQVRYLYGSPTLTQEA